MDSDCTSTQQQKLQKNTQKIILHTLYFIFLFYIKLKHEKSSFILAIFVGVALIVQHIERDNLFSGRGGKQPRSGGPTPGHHRSTQGSDTIVVSSKDPELAALFNLTRVQQRVGSTGLNNSNNNGEISGYTLDDKGAIDFPVLGNLTVAGMTRSQIAALVKQRLKEENLVNDPVVTVEFMNLSFSVLGEVKTPGKYSISKDYITLLEAISMAGDLTIYGKRDAIFVIREEKGERVTHWVDLRSCDLFKSPVYYLKQNDVVYVQPNKVRAGQSTLNENSVKSVGLWISIGSFLTSLGVLLFK